MIQERFSSFSGCLLLFGVVYPFLLIPPITAAQAQMLCTEGKDGFKGKSRTGVTVVVGANHAQELAARSCTARLVSGGNSLIVTEHAAEIDLDMLDVTLEAGVPVAGFQIKQTPSSCCINYIAYSLRGIPKLLFSIGGGSTFTAEDTDLDGRVEFWTDDADVINGFDGLTLPEFDFVPTYVLRFSEGALHDVSSEFTEFYDGKISLIRAGIEPIALQQFVDSDGKLSPHGVSPANMEHLHRLRRTKIAVLEMVWGYLYSGREQQAWQVLNDMWPASDRERIRRAIVSAREHGIRTQFSDALPEPRQLHKRKRVMIYSLSGDNAAHPILMRGFQPFQGSWGLEFTIDAAGKVHSVVPSEDKVILPEGLIAAARAWKFIPGWRADRSVASKVKLDVFLLR